MPHYDIGAVVTVDVVITVEADSPDAAKELFDSHIMMTASLVDVLADKFEVSEDSIRECTIAAVEQVE